MTPMDIEPAGDAAKYGNTDALYRTLSSWQGVLLGMGVEIQQVKVSHVLSERPVNQNLTKDSSTPPTQSRRQLKLATLAAAYSDKLVTDGYLLEEITLRDMTPSERQDPEWAMQVLIAVKDAQPTAPPAEGRR